MSSFVPFGGILRTRRVVGRLVLKELNFLHKHYRKQISRYRLRQFWRHILGTYIDDWSGMGLWFQRERLVNRHCCDEEYKTIKKPRQIQKAYACYWRLDEFRFGLRFVMVFEGISGYIWFNIVANIAIITQFFGDFRKFSTFFGI